MKIDFTKGIDFWRKINHHQESINTSNMIQKQKTKKLKSLFGAVKNRVDFLMVTSDT